MGQVTLGIVGRIRLRRLQTQVVVKKIPKGRKRRRTHGLDTTHPMAMMMKVMVMTTIGKEKGFDPHLEAKIGEDLFACIIDMTLGRMELVGREDI